MLLFTIIIICITILLIELRKTKELPTSLDKLVTLFADFMDETKGFINNIKS